MLALVILSSCKSAKKAPVASNGLESGYAEEEYKSNLTDSQKKKWQHLDLEADQVPGMSVEKAYQFLKGKKSVTVTVGVIDAGVDLKHEDLKDVAWVNKDEIDGNGIDDDKNGYVDDINGWNFIGKMHECNLEYERIAANPSIASPEVYKKAKAYYDEDVSANKQSIDYLSSDRKILEENLKKIDEAEASFQKHFGHNKYTKKDILNIKTEDAKLKENVAYMKKIFDEGDGSIQELKEYYQESLKYIDVQYEKSQEIIDGKNLKKNFRAVIGDNPEVLNDSPGYGNANVGPLVVEEIHGTHVAGIIGAKRGNGVGMDGVADNVAIMAIRAVPNGDEYDKDIALAIRYAVDNGAKVINTSFGKGFSPHASWVFNAIKYAAEKDVLIVNAAGNEALNNDKEFTYPNDAPDLLNEISDNFITVGASGSNYDESLPANFSNYGKKNVDVFAPGEDIYSSITEDKYEGESGTSMASPCVAGVAAMLRSYYPQLSASQVKNIIIKSGKKIDLKVARPTGMSFMTGLDGDSEEEPGLISFSDLCASGRIVNAYNAVIMADKMVNNK